MIFVTVGSQLPFDRLIEAIDIWAANNKEQAIFAQIGNSKYSPKNIEFSQTIEPIEYQKRMEESDVIIAHAGMGTIISSLELGKPLLLMPRLADKGEHRNDHQSATIKRFASFSNIKVATDEQFLPNILSEMLKDSSKNNHKIETRASEELITVIKNFALDV